MFYQSYQQDSLHPVAKNQTRKYFLKTENFIFILIMIEIYRKRYFFVHQEERKREQGMSTG